MKNKLIFKNLIILISITSLLNFSTSVDFAKKSKDYKDKYGVYLVLAK